MTITMSPNATQVGQADAENSSNMDWFLLMQRLHGDGLGAGGGPGTHTVIKMYESESRTEGENISYGKAVRIDQNNLSQLGLTDVSGLATYHMDSEGHMTHIESGINDFSGMSQEGFLVHMDGDARSYTTDARTGDITINSARNDAPMAMTIQRVEVNGATQGYFVAGEGQSTGVYLDASALDYSKMSPEIRDQLMQAETPEGPKLEDRQPDMRVETGLRM
ncbi:MAG: hypothetical protein H6858_02770 [Rhodospirillales bacterium]|nr:hypothetical protein [Alphaproteobacteria bacterium]MCB9976506.1 hypothetical protein [Rhodospirillales bacterium]